MPYYRFLNPQTGEVKDISQKMNDIHEYSENGIVFERVWSCPGAAIDANVDPFNSGKYVDKTFNQKMTLGQCWEHSKELSEKRKNKLGHDPIKEGYKKEYSEKRHGMTLTEKK